MRMMLLSVAMQFNEL